MSPVSDHRRILPVTFLTGMAVILVQGTFGTLSTLFITFSFSDTNSLLLYTALC
jgi:hypothetical protein